MTVEVPNTAGYPNGDLKSQKPNTNDRRRRRRKPKKSNKVEDTAAAVDVVANGGADGGVGDTAKENSDYQKSLAEQVEVEYVPEKAELDGELDEEFRKVFEKFSFTATTRSEENDKKDETVADAALKKKDDSDSEEEQDAPKEKGISNKKKKLQRRMKIAELKQICIKPDVVEFEFLANFSVLS